MASKVEMVVLGLLDDGAAHGYELLERFHERSMGFSVEVGKASVYQTLHRLERDGLVTGRAQDSDDGPDRRVYKITRSGRDRLRAGLIELSGDQGPYQSDAGAALAFVGDLPATEQRKALDARESALQGLLSAISDERARAGVANPMLDRQEALAKGELAWLKGFRAKRR